MRSSQNILLHVAAVSALLLSPLLANAGVHGLEPMPEGAATPISAALADFDAHAQGRQKFSGRIVEICQNKGCWVVLEDEGSSARVMMHEHKFGIPKDASGTAIVYGQLERKTLDPKQREHLAAESKGPVEEVEYRIDAFAVEVEG
jgi:hypothetical protein